MTTKRTTKMMMAAILAMVFVFGSQAVEIIESDCLAEAEGIATLAVVGAPQGVVEDALSIDEYLNGCLDECFEQFLMTAENVVEEEPAKVIRVAVVDFSSAAGESFTSCNITMKSMDKAGPQFSEAVASRISDWSEYEIVDRDVVTRAITKYKLSKKGLHSEASLKKLAELLDVQLVLIGQTEGTAWSGKGHAGGSLFASIQMLSAVNADVLWSIDGSITDAQSSRQLVPSLADDMTGRLYAEIQAVESVQSMLALRTVER
jgi:hypothetical protein